MKDEELAMISGQVFTSCPVMPACLALWLGPLQGLDYWGLTFV